MAIITATSDVKKKKKEKKEVPEVSLSSQLRLAEILNDSPRLVSLNGTEWEVRALRLGTQWLIAEEILKVHKEGAGEFADVLKELSKCIPAVLNIITFALLNNKKNIFKDGDESLGFSETFYSTRDTLEWECDITYFGNILVEVLQLVDVSFFFTALNTVEIFRATTTEMKRMRTKEQK